MKSYNACILLLILLLSACSSTVPQTEVQLPSKTSTVPDATQSPGETATQALVETATPAPVILPVDRFTAIPALAGITPENAAGLKNVAVANDSQILNYGISEDRITLQFASETQTFSLPDLSLIASTPLRLSPFTRTSAISPDGKYVARTYPAADHPLKPVLFIWDVETGKEICKIDSLDVITANFFNIQFHSELNMVSLSGDLSNDMGGSRGRVIFWALDNCRQILDVSSESFFTPPISSDARYTAIVRNEQTVVYEVKTNKQTPIGDALDVRGIGFIPESGKVIVSYRTRTAIYDLASNEEVASFASNVGNYFTEVSSFNGGEWIAVMGYEKNYFWNAAENKVYQIGQALFGGLTFQNGVVSSAQSIFNLKTGSKISIQSYGFQPQIAWSSDANYAAISAGAPPFVTDIYDTSTGKKIAALPDVHTPIALDSGTFLVSGNHQVHVVNFSSGEISQTFEGSYVGGVSHAGRVIGWNALGEFGWLDVESGKFDKKSALNVFPLGATRYLQYPDSLSVWNGAFDGGFDSVLSHLGWDFSIDSLAVSDDRTMAVQQGAEQLIQIYQGMDGILLPESSRVLVSYENKPYYSIFKFSPDNSVIAGASRQLTLWDAKTGSEIKRFGLSIGAIMDMQFSPDGSKVALSGNDIGAQANVFGNLALMVFDVPGKKLIQQYELKQQLRKTGCNVTLPIAFSSDGTQIYTLTQDCRIGLYDIENFKEVRSFGSPYSDYAISFALSPDEKILAVALAKRFELWDVSSGKLIKKFDIPQLAGNYGNYYHKTTFTLDGKALVIKSGVSFSNFSTITIWGIPETR